MNIEVSGAKAPDCGPSLATAAPGSLPAAAALRRVERLAEAFFQVQQAAIILDGTSDDTRLPPAGAGFHAEAPLLSPAGMRLGVLRLRSSVPRPVLTGPERAVLADLAAMAADALERQRDVATRQDDIDRLALRERLLGVVADAPDFTAAIEAAMAAVLDATHCRLCLFFRLAPDGEILHLVGGQANTPVLTAAYFDHLRQTVIRIDNSLIGEAIVGGEQLVVSGIDGSALSRYPALNLSVTHSIAAQIVTPLSLGAERYAFSVGFGPEVADIGAMAATLRGLASSIRPLLRRLRDSEATELFRRVVEASNDSVVISEVPRPGHPEARICYVNAAFCAQAGYRREDVLGSSYRLLQGRETPPDVAQSIAAALAAGHPVRHDVLNRRSDGSRFWVDSNMAPVVNVTGSYTHWVAIERDITDRKLAQESVALNEQRFRLVAQATADAVWDWDLATGALWWNDGMQTQFGYGVATLPQDFAAWAACIAPEDRERVVKGRQDAACGPAAGWRDEYRFHRADGTVALVTDQGFNILDAAGTPVRMVGSMTDITRERQLEEQIRQSQRLDAIGKLTGGVAHDFNNLLAVIIGNAELMKERAGHDPALARPAEVIIAAADRGAALTSRLLAFARLHPLAPKPTDVNRLLGKMEEMVQRLIGEAIEVTFVPSTGPAIATVDAPQLENAVLNLCINARDAMPQGGRLVIEAATTRFSPASAPNPDMPPGTYVTIAVTDNGTGMTKEVAARAFDPFFTTKAFGKGSGLGLSMVFGFVSQSNGHVEIASEAGQGSCVTLYLQAADSLPDAAEPPSPAPEPRAADAKILLVEDDDAVRRIVRAMLERLGYRVLTAANGKDALATLQTTADVDLLFTDIVMPGGLTGYQLAQHARALNPALLVLFTSGYPDNVLPDMSGTGAAALLPKPYRMTELATSIRALLNPAG